MALDLDFEDLIVIGVTSVFSYTEVYVIAAPQQAEGETAHISSGSICVSCESRAYASSPCSSDFTSYGHAFET